MEADSIAAVEVSGGQAALIDLCFYFVSQNATSGWERVPGLDARFGEVRVAAPGWETYHAFGGEDVPAGTRVQVLSGNESGMGTPANEAGAPKAHARRRDRSY